MMNESARMTKRRSRPHNETVRLSHRYMSTALQAGGLREISRWWNHRFSAPNRARSATRPSGAREGSLAADGLADVSASFSRPSRARLHWTRVLMRPGGSRSLRFLHHRLFSLPLPGAVAQPLSGSLAPLGERVRVRVRGRLAHCFYHASA